MPNLTTIIANTRPQRTGLPIATWFGGANPRRGSGLVGLSDHFDALGGTVELTSPAGSGTTLLIRSRSTMHDARAESVIAASRN
ncbi:MAG: hypothetical protein QOG59_2689 [Solirubrobacteraceae bacterium]|nr:hypothetical protein [Solirubrobacteraceae bacterium]